MNHPAYHGAISKEQCEDLLSRKGRTGAYLIRDSETIQGAWCLCVLKQKVVYTYRILQTHSGHLTLQTSTGVEEKFFKTVKDLIRHYKQRNQGLATHLRNSVKKKVLVEDVQEHPASAVPEEDNDYENIDSSEYIVVLP